MADYPGSLVSYTPKTDGVDDVLAAHINAVQVEIEAIEAELGTDPRGSAADVATRLDAIEATAAAAVTFLTSPLTSTSWDGDARSSTSKTLIDLSAVFGAPAGISAILVRMIARDSGSAASTSAYFALSPNSTAASHAAAVRPAGVTNDAVVEIMAVVPCDSNGDVYYQNGATGASTMDVWLEIWGYWA